MKRHHDTRHWLDKGRYAYPFFILIGVVIWYALAGCASPLPPREVYVAWSTPCSRGPDVRRVRFVDTAAPVLACVQASTGIDAAQMILLSLMGFPPAACAMTVYGRPGTVDTAVIYAPISPSPAQIAMAIGTLRPPEEIVTHELQHVFGSDHPALLPDAKGCAQ